MMHDTIGFFLQAIESLRHQLDMQQKNYKKKCDRLEELGGEFKRLKASSAGELCFQCFKICDFIYMLMKLVL